jgi:hypothetical protein
MAGNPLVGDTAPFVPEEEQVKVEEDKLQTEMAKLGSSKAKWPRITEFAQDRQEFYRRFFPGGVELKNIPAAERGNWWLMADTIVREYDAFMDVINEVADAKRRRPPTPTEKV